jgi:anti-anti-sigma regulatory factor
MIHLTVQNSGTLGVLTLKGSLSEPQAGELRTHLARGIDRVSRLIVNCEQVTSLDMACLKLLCTAYRVSHVLKKEFALAGDRTALFRRATGADASAYCSGNVHECKTGCLWTDWGPEPYRANDASAPEAMPDIAAA